MLRHRLCRHRGAARALLDPDRSAGRSGDMTKRTPARRIGSVLCCIIALLLAAGRQTPVGVERLDASTAQRRLTANVLTTDDLSPQAANVLRRLALSLPYEDDPAIANAPTHAIAADGPRSSQSA